MTPILAVVGHPNKGKSSIVATLSENTQVHIGPIPGTTTLADHFRLTIDGQALYTLVDTPGFQRAGQVYNWLQSHEGDASTRAELVRLFVETHEGDPVFADECTLLKPIIEGAGILYVVDGSKPYGAEYELEMEILRWTGQPRMALINMIGSADYRQAWRQGLGQYFSLVREFNAHAASFEQRLELLRGFGAIDESWQAPMQDACRMLQADRQQQRKRSAMAIAVMLQDALAARIESPVNTSASGQSPDQSVEEALHKQLTERLMQTIRKAETHCRAEVAKIYRHGETPVDIAQISFLNTSLFTEQAWQLFGLSRLQLVATGAVSGALAGAGFDIITGGTSLLLGSTIGGALGSITAWFGGPEVAKIKVLGSTLGGEIATAGPIKNPNFPWVLLGRACLYHQLISERNHALRTTMVSNLTNTAHFFDFLSTQQRNRVARSITQVQKGSASGLHTLRDAIDEVLKLHAQSQSEHTG